MRNSRIVCTVAPRTWFGGRDYLGGKVLTDTLAELGFELFLLDTECFFQKDRPRIEESLRQLRQFAPDFAISTPNAGYGIGAQVEVSGRLSNVFTELLQVPLALCWDDPLGQFSGLFLAPLPGSPQESESGALQRMRTGINHPLLSHYGWDTGHIRTMVDLGLLAEGKAVFNMLPALPPYADFGKTHGLSSSFDQDVCFAGNVYLNQITADPLHQVPEIARLAERIAERKLAGFAPSSWELLMGELQEMSKADRARLKLSPDDSFFWQTYRYLVWVAINTRVRMGVLSAVQHPIHFYGAFADPEGVSRFSDYPNIQYRGSVDYIQELPAVFNRSKITVDVTNQLAQRSAPCKLFECFAAGGFMLLDRRPDLIDVFGQAAEKISYNSVEELNTKIDYYLAHESERKDLIRHFQNQIQREHTAQAWLLKIIENLQQRAEPRHRARTAQTQPGAQPLLHWKGNFLAEATWRQRHTLAQAQTQTRGLHDALRRYMPPGHPGDLPFHEWGKLMACGLEFAPDLILEIGRGYGNSTLAFTQVANLLKPIDCRVVSVCLTPWEEIRAAVSTATTPDWFAPLTVYQQDLHQFDFEAALLGARRVLVFWDAHGYDIAECILGRLMPVLSTREHLVLMHDIGDARYQDHSTSYGDYGLWKGELVWPGPMIRLGNVIATVPQAVSVLDFASRNEITLRSGAHSLHSRFDVQANEAQELRTLLGEDFFDLASGCAWYTLNEAAGPYHFPRSSTIQLAPPPTAATSNPPPAVLLAAPEPPADTVQSFDLLRARFGRMLARSGPISERELLPAMQALDGLLNADDFVGYLRKHRQQIPDTMVPLLLQHLQAAWTENNLALSETLETVYGFCTTELNL